MKAFKVALLIWIILLSNIFAATMEPAVEKIVKPLNIAFFIGNNTESFGKGKGGAITYDFAYAISQNAPGMAIVSDYILKNVILRKYSQNPDHILVKIDLDLTNKDIYHVQGTQFFVLVPHDFDNPIFNKAKWTKIDISANDEYNGSAEEGYPKILWAEDTPTEVKRLLSDENLKYIPYAKTLTSDIVPPTAAVITKKFEPPQLSLIFNPIENPDILRLSQIFNIYMSGHGDYSSDTPEKSTVAGLLVSDIAAMLLFFNDKINTKSVRISTCAAGGKNLDLIQIKNNMPIRIKYLLIVDAITDAPTTSDWASEDASTDNLKRYFDALAKFQEGYDEFVEKLDIIRAKKASADAGELKKIKEEIRSLEKESGLDNVLGKISLPKLWYFKSLGPNSYPQVWIPEIGWFQTFSRNVNITDAGIMKALGKVQLKEFGINPSQPVKALSLSLDGSIEIKGKLALLLYSEIVFGNLEITPVQAPLPSEKLPHWLTNLYKYFPSIPCLESVCKNIAIKKDFYIYPQIISMQHGDSINLFSRINLPNAGTPTVQNGILNFLRDSFLILRGRVSSKTFFIKELEGFNDFSEVLDGKDEFKKFLDGKKQENQRIVLKNIFINTRLTGFFKKDSTSITLSFECMGKAWALSYLAKNLNPESPVPPTNKDQFLWKFKESKKGSHEGNLSFYGLTYLAKLNFHEYQTQLLILRDLFKRQTKSLKEFLIDFDPDNIRLAMEEFPKIAQSEWKNFEQQTQLNLSLKKLKRSLSKLKSNLALLNSKLLRLKIQLEGATQ
jgi:soluble cytochrome b562